MSESTTGEASVAAGEDIVRVMIVDDAVVIRGLIARILESDPTIKVVSSVANGELAVKAIKRDPVDVVVLDIEMPVMDGMTALPLLLEASPETRVIMASTLTQRNATISLDALAKGAADYVPKPSAARDIHSSDDFRRDIIAKVKALGQAARRGGRVAPAPKPVDTAPAAAPTTPLVQSAPLSTRTASAFAPEILAIGSSTGGPQALFRVFEMLGPDIGVPTVITQHMPPTFTSILADHIGRFVDGRCREAEQGEELVPGLVYVAPGDFHLTVAGGTKTTIRLNQDPPENFCRPAVDPMFRSVAKVFGARSMAVVLTGMGADGLLGGRALVEAGGTLIAQDEATSVVWGMPGAVANDGICSAILPIDDVGPAIKRVLSGGQL